MYLLSVAIVLASAIPPTRAVIRLAKLPKEQKSKPAIWGLAILTLFSVALLLTFNHFKLLY